jgi:hypothetical protein
MDHDDMSIIGRDRQHFWPARGLVGMAWDERHIVGGDLDGTQVKGIAGALREVYRVSDQSVETAMAQFRESVRSAYRKTQAAVVELPAVRALFPESFVEGIRDLDTIAVNFLNAADRQVWRVETRVFLTSRGYSPDLVDDYLRAVPNREGYLRRMAFLFVP